MKVNRTKLEEKPREEAGFPAVWGSVTERLHKTLVRSPQVHRLPITQKDFVLSDLHADSMIPSFVWESPTVHLPLLFFSTRGPGIFWSGFFSYQWLDLGWFPENHLRPVFAGFQLAQVSPPPVCVKCPPSVLPLWPALASTHTIHLTNIYRVPLRCLAKMQHKIHSPLDSHSCVGRQKNN